MILTLALLALAPPTDSGVWLDTPPKPGTVVTAPLDVRGATQALEGVLRVDLFEVNGATVRLVQTLRPAVPVGTIPFSFRWEPKSPGTVTLRVVATTLVRGFSAEAPGLVVPAADPPRDSAARAAAEHAAAARARAATDRAAALPAAAPLGRLDDSGRVFGTSGPVLPYAPSPPPSAPSAQPPTVRAAAVAAPPDRAAWTSVAAGLLLLVVSAHLHLVLRRDSS